MISVATSSDFTSQSSFKSIIWYDYKSNHTLNVRIMSIYFTQKERLVKSTSCCFNCFYECICCLIQQRLVCSDFRRFLYFCLFAGNYQNIKNNAFKMRIFDENLKTELLIRIWIKYNFVVPLKSLIFNDGVKVLKQCDDKLH